MVGTAYGAFGSSASEGSDGGSAMEEVNGIDPVKRMLRTAKPRRESAKAREK